MHDALLITAHLASLGAAPALTDYTTGGRLEVSGRVALTWAHKITGLLRDELGAEEGDVLGVDLPASWRAPLWSLGALLAGLHPVVGPGGGHTTGSADRPLATVTHRPDLLPADAGDILALAEPSLALRWPGELPAGAIDASADTLAQPDDLILDPTPTEGDALLLAASDVGRRTAEGSRIAAVPADPLDAVTLTLGVWLARGSAVLLAGGTGAEEAARLAEVERAELRD